MPKIIKNKKGLALVAAIMLIVFVSITVLRLSTFIVQWFKQLDTDQINNGCLYLAQAGIQDAIYKVRSSYLSPATTYGSFTTEQSADIDGAGGTYRRGVSTLSPTLAGAADLLMVNTATSTISTTTVTGARYQNATGTAFPITINKIKVEWVKTGTVVYFRQLKLNNTTVFTSAANNVSGYEADITDKTYNTAAFSTTANSVIFSATVASGLTSIDLTYTMTDGSSKKVRIYPASSSNQFSICSTGKVAGSNIYRTIKATYDLTTTATPAAANLTTAKIMDIEEIDAAVNSP